MGVMLRCLVQREDADTEQVSDENIIELRDHGVCLLNECTEA